MGVTISFVQVTPEQLRAAIDDERRARELYNDLCVRQPGGWLDRAWCSIDFLMAGAGVTIDLLMDPEPMDDRGVLHAWHPEQVAETAGLLRATPWERLAEHYDPVELSRREVYPNLHLWDADDIGLPEEGYAALVGFFDTAARAGAGAIMCHSF